MSKIAASKLEVVVQTGGLRGRVYELGVPSQHLFLGRHRACDVIFPTDAQHMMVGRIHAVIESRPDGLFLLNLHPNGTTVNEALVGEDGEQRLTEGAVIQLGGRGPLLTLRQVFLPPAAALVAPPAPPPLISAAAAAPPPNGPSPKLQGLLQSFSRNLLALNDKLEAAGGGSVLANDILDELEVIVSKLADLRALLGSSSQT